MKHCRLQNESHLKVESEQRSPSARQSGCTDAHSVQSKVLNGWLLTKAEELRDSGKQFQ